MVSSLTHQTLGENRWFHDPWPLSVPNPPNKTLQNPTVKNPWKERPYILFWDKLGIGDVCPFDSLNPSNHHTVALFDFCPPQKTGKFITPVGDQSSQQNPANSNLCILSLDIHHSILQLLKRLLFHLAIFHTHFLQLQPIWDWKIYPVDATETNLSK